MTVEEIWLPWSEFSRFGRFSYVYVNDKFFVKSWRIISFEISVLLWIYKFKWCFMKLVKTVLIMLNFVFFLLNKVYQYIKRKVEIWKGKTTDRGRGRSMVFNMKKKPTVNEVVWRNPNWLSGARKAISGIHRLGSDYIQNVPCSGEESERNHLSDGFKVHKLVIWYVYEPSDLLAWDWRLT